MDNKGNNKYPRRFFIGTQKAGSSYFYNLLKSHRDVSLHSLSEINFFSFNYDKGIDWYLAGFSGDKNKIDISPKYFMLGNKVVPRIMAYADKYLKNDKPLFVLMLRNPIDYLYSHFQMQILQDKSGKLAKERGGFVDFLRINPGYLQRAKYAKILKNYWFKDFDKKQFKVVIFEDFVKENEQEMAKILSFWQIPKRKLTTPVTSQNKMLRFKFLIKWRNRVAKSHKLKEFLKQSRSFNILYNNILTLKSGKRLNKDERREIKEMLYQDVRDLRELLDADLTAWQDFN